MQRLDFAEITMQRRAAPPPRWVARGARVATPRRGIGWLAAVLAIAQALAIGQSEALAAPSAAPSPKTLDSRALTPGMRGYGLTVVRGQKVERFDVEVIGVIHNKLPDQDMILIRCAGLGLEHSGVVAGMSGSPVYVQDPAKGDLLIGAVAYAFPFNKDPVAGVTPIKDMLPELDRPLRPLPDGQKIGPPAKRSAASTAPTVAGPHAVSGVDVGALQPLATPIAAAGFAPEVLRAAAADWDAYGFGRLEAASGGGSAIPLQSEPFQPGSAISLVLARGDMSLAGVGTVTWVRDDRFIAFGHPFQGVGQIHLPVGNAHVLWILASQLNSFKMAVPTSTLGVLDMDRQAAVAGRIGPQPTWIPVRIDVRGKGIRTAKTWNVEIADQPRFVPLIGSMIIHNALSVSEPIADAASVRVRIVAELEGRAPVTVADHFVSLEGTGGLGEVRALAMGLLKALSWNGFSRLLPKSLRVELEVDDARDIVFLEAARLPAVRIVAGKPTRLRLELQKPNDGVKYVDLTLPALPRDLAGSKVTLWIGPAAEKPLERPEPASIDDILASIAEYQPHNRLAVVIQLPDRSWSVRGHRLTNLPVGTLAALDGHGRRVSRGHSTIRTHVDLPWTINGQGALEVEVREP